MMPRALFGLALANSGLYYFDEKSNRFKGFLVRILK
jgi:hypothetical protein